MSSPTPLPPCQSSPAFDQAPVPLFQVPLIHQEAPCRPLARPLSGLSQFIPVVA